VNFGLRVLGRRSDGYHELESVFLPLDLADALELELAEAPRAQVELDLQGAAQGAPVDATNLAVRAAAAFLEAARLCRSVRLRLAKRIPSGAGLGGGSSDAGAVLRGLAACFPDALGAEALGRLALALGADVPFFLDPRPALVSGIGERCEPLGVGWPPHVLLLANPGESLSTAHVYAAFDATPPPAAAAASLRAQLAAGEDLAALLRNDLEPTAERLCPAIGRLREALFEVGARAVGLSGSGATLFGVFPSVAQAEAGLRRLPAARFPGLWTRVARTAEAG